MSKGMSNRVRRRNEFLAYFISKYEPNCAWCNKPFNPEEFYEWKDTLTIHHLNGKHEDNRDENKCIVHRSCHQKIHKHLLGSWRDALLDSRQLNLLRTLVGLVPLEKKG